MGQTAKFFVFLRKNTEPLDPENEKNYGTRKILPEYGSFTLLPDA